MKRISFLFIIAIFFATVLHSAEHLNKPMKSAMLSLLAPGGGQFYNKKYVKSAFVAAGEIYLISITSYHISKQNYYLDIYKKTQSQAAYQDFVFHYERKQSDIFWLGLYLVLSATDAFVDSHLSNFEKEKKRVHLIFDNKLLGVSYEF